MTCLWWHISFVWGGNTLVQRNVFFALIVIQALIIERETDHDNLIRDRFS